MGGTSANHDACLGLALLGAGAGRGFLRLLGHHDADCLWRASARDLQARGLAPQAAARLIELRRSVRVDEVRAAMKAADLRFVPFSGEEYPPELTHLELPPAGLFIRGGGEALRGLLASPRVTIVGTRLATSYGVRAAEQLAAAFAVAGVVVASGLAMGIDARAHKAALAVSGVTVAVLGCGADVVYPRRNLCLYESIAATGLVISELPPGFRPARWTFPHRNRILAALGDAVVVVEAPPGSGALQTAECAAELGRPVQAVPGSIFMNGCKGCNSLLHDGASPVLDARSAVEDFLSQTRIERGARQVDGDWRLDPRSHQQLCLVASLTPRGELVWNALADGRCTIDVLIGHTGLAIKELMTALAELELAGMVRREGPAAYARAP